MAVGNYPLPDFPVIQGLRIGIAEAGIKKAGRKDLVLFELAPDSTCAGVFTRNAFCAAPVTICKQNLAEGLNAPQSTYLLVNTGNANAGTGDEGMQDALACCETVAQECGVEIKQVLPFSTGVIGEKLPVEKIQAGVSLAKANLNESNWAAAAAGIMTTDTRPKGTTVTVNYAGETITINGVSKGAGMIRPNMATMLAYVGTDAKLSPELTQALVKECAEASFNRITVDGDTSTNDACMLMATGQAKAPEVDEEHADYPAFKTALKALFIELAQLIIKDAEGATKFVSVVVEQAQSEQEALDVAYTIAHSPLVKTALYASDPNWGRILAALGRAPVDDLDLSRVKIYLDDVRIVSNGGRCAHYTEERGQDVMNRESITIRIELARGDIAETVWTSDFSHEYVTVNAEYRT